MTEIDKIDGFEMTIVRFLEKRNNKFNTSNFNRIFDGLKNWRQNDFFVEHGVVKPGNWTCRNKMLETVLIYGDDVIAVWFQILEQFVIDDFFLVLIALWMPILTASQAHLCLSW